MRIDRMLANSGYGTRSEVRKMISRGLFCVNGTVVKDPSFAVNENDIVTAGDKEISSRSNLYYKLDKPDCYLTAMEDKRLPTVADLIPSNIRTKKISPVGRLDYHTTGLLILTNDGKLSHRLTSPRYDVPKTYLIGYSGDALGQEHVRMFSEGIVLEDTDGKIPLKPASLRLIDDNTCELTITEGKTHQVRRMLAKFGRSVITLRRIRIGNITVDGLREGIPEEMTDDEITELKRALGIST